VWSSALCGSACEVRINWSGGKLEGRGYGEERSDEEVGGRRAKAHREEAQKNLRPVTLKGVELAPRPYTVFA
jgi:hypothetical protein